MRIVNKLLALFYVAAYAACVAVVVGVPTVAAESSMQSIHEGLQEGFYGGIVLSEEFVDARLEKSVASPGVAAMTATDSENENDFTLDALGVALGYRFDLTESVYFATELDFTAHKGATRGFLSGTGTGGDDVWPGAWSVERNRSAGVTFKLGYRLRGDSVLNSIYALTGVRWLPLNTEVHAAGNDSAGQPSAAVSRRDFDVHPWVAGAGLTFAASDSGVFNLEARYMEYDVDWFFDGASDPAGTVIRHDMDVREWGLTLGYVWGM